MADFPQKEKLYIINLTNRGGHVKLEKKYLLTYMGVFHLWFVRLGDPTAQQINMYDTSPESWACGAVYRLCLMLIQSIAW